MVAHFQVKKVLNTRNSTVYKSSLTNEDWVLKRGTDVRNNDVVSSVISNSRCDKRSKSSRTVFFFCNRV